MIARRILPPDVRMFESRPPRRRRPTTPVRVTSLNPVRDAKTIGHEVATSRTVLDAQSSALQQRYRRLLADAATAEGEDERVVRLETLLVHVGWACETVAEDLVALGKMHHNAEQRDALLLSVGNELIALAELSVSGLVPDTWEKALADLRGVAERLIRMPQCSAAQLAELDLVLERIDHAESLAAEALRTILGASAEE